MEEVLVIVILVAGAGYILEINCAGWEVLVQETVEFNCA